MKTTQKGKSHCAYALWVKKCLVYQTPLVLLFVALFIFSGKLSASTSPVLINEIQTAGISANDEFIEIYNPSPESIDISNWSIQYKGGGGASYYKKNFVGGSVIPAKGFFLVAHGGSGNYSGETVYDMSWSQSLSSVGGNIFLVNNQTLITDSNTASIIDKVAYGVTDDLEHTPAVAPGAGKSIGRIDGKDTDDNFADFFVLENPSPKKENEKAKEKTPAPPKTYPTGIMITELFPNPFESQYEEYIELYNGSSEDIDLLGWSLHDASKTGKYTFLKSTVLQAKKYLAIFKEDFKFALNNSGDESVTLFDPNGKEVAKTEYDGSKRNVSYNFDGSRWRWSKFLTPGEENILNNEPYGTLKIEKDVFKNIYADFSISTGDADGDKIKVTWDFGDNHKSYLVKTRHKYEKTGTYQASVKLSDGSEDIVKNFTVEVKKYPHPEVRIIAVNANPEGSDSIFETITIENKSKKKINLKGWSIATGWKKFVNHPINEDVVIKKSKSKEITRKDSSFTLNNTKSKIQLRYPDGEVAHEVKYKTPNKSIADGEVYKKVEGGWEWISQKPITKIQDTNKIQKTITNTQNDTDAEKVDENKTEEIIIPVEIERENKLVSLNNENVKIELLKSQPRVLGAETVREVDGTYFLTPVVVEQEHYSVSFLKNILSLLNLKLNLFLNYFFR